MTSAAVGVARKECAVPTILRRPASNRKQAAKGKTPAPEKSEGESAAAHREATGDPRGGREEEVPRTSVKTCVRSLVPDFLRRLMERK